MLGSKKVRIASIFIGIGITILLVVIGFQFFAGGFTRASDQVPRDVVVSTTTQNSAQVSWSTGIETQGVIEYGTSPTALNFFAPESATTKTHQLDLTLLSPATAYYFQIRIGDSKYDNGGVPWTFNTKTVAANPTPVIPVSSPTPVSTIVVPNPTATAAVSSCAETDCTAICKKLGNGCTTGDLDKNNCIGKVQISTCLAITPTPKP